MKKRPLEPLDPARPLPPNLDWYVILTSPKQEYRVARWLEGQGWATLVPLVHHWRRVNHRQKVRRKITSPLMPRFVIAGFAGEVPWLPILDMFHIQSVLGVNGSPVKLRPGEAERLQSSSQALLKDEPGKELMKGGRAVYTGQGLFEGKIVEISSLTGKWAMVKGLFDVEVRVKLDNLEAA